MDQCSIATQQEVGYVTAGRHVKIPKKYKTHLYLYYRFAKDVCEPGYLYFDQTASEQIYVWETFGAKKYTEIFDSATIDTLNGFHHGKRWLDITIAAWKEDIAKGNLLIEELEAEYPAFVIKKLRL